MKGVISLLIWIFLFQQISDVTCAVSSCGGRLIGNSNTFTSPGYPGIPEKPNKSPISDQITCEWEIVVPAGKGILLKFGHFDMNAPKYPDECAKGEVEIFSGTGKTKRTIDTYCPENKPDDFALTENTATVVFRRPSTFTGTGFLISYLAITPKQPISDFVTCTDVGEALGSVTSFSLMCPSGCGSIENHAVYGNLPYQFQITHLCRAAVHAGVISDVIGGRIDAKIQRNSMMLGQSTANNVSTHYGTSSDYSFTFPAASACREKIPFEADQLSASSYVNTTDKLRRFFSWHPSKAMYDSDGSSWSPNVSTGSKQWIQVDLGKPMNITGILTKGSENPYSWLKTFEIKYSDNGAVFKDYKETGQIKPKIFLSKTVFTGVRNNFVDPPIVAKYFRLYPNIKETYENIELGVKFALTGCDLQSDGGNDDVIIDPKPLEFGPLSSTTSSTTKSRTTTSKATKKMDTNTSSRKTSVAYTITNTTYIASTSTTAQSSTVPVENNPGDKEDDLDATGSGLDEKSIITIAALAALAFIILLLVALVVVLIQKKKKDPDHRTVVPDPNQSYSATRNGIGMNQMPLNTAGHVEVTAGPSIIENSLYDGNMSTFRREEHEYQDIPPLQGGNVVDGRFSVQNFSNRANAVAHPPSLITTGNGEKNDFYINKNRMTSFAAPPSQPHIVRQNRAGTFPNRMQYSVNHDETHPFLSTEDHSPFAGNHLPVQNLLSGQPHRSSLPSTASSSRNSDPLQGTTSSTNPEISLSSEDAAHTHSLDRVLIPEKRGRKASYNIPTSNQLAHPLPMTTFPSNGFAGGVDEPLLHSNGSTNHPNLHRSTSKTDPTSQARSRSGYDQLYKSKSLSTNAAKNCSVAIENNDYNQLNLR